MLLPPLGNAAASVIQCIGAAEEEANAETTKYGHKKPKAVAYVPENRNGPPQGVEYHLLHHAQLSMANAGKGCVLMT